jgi:dipeptidyl aminopeptidase/acylaminoacyl peptidase
LGIFERDNHNPDKMKKTLAFVFVALFALTAVNSQEALKYMMPPDAIVKIVDAPATPAVIVSPDKALILLAERQGLISIKELSMPELRLAGIRVDPLSGGPSRQTYNTGFTLMNIDGSGKRTFSGMPAEPKLGFPVWANDGRKFAFTNRNGNDFELWTGDVASMSVRKIAGGLNLVFGGEISWLPDNNSIIFLIKDPNRGSMPVRSTTPEGPVVQENLGKKGQAATFQDLLKDPADEAIFEFLAKSELIIWDGTKLTSPGIKGMIASVNPSPDGNFLLVNTLRRPFTYLLPYSGFASVTAVYGTDGKLLKTLFEKPVTENLPRGYDMVLPGPRGFFWRSDKAATLYWVEALDGGDYNKEAQFHDQVYTLAAPFTGEPEKFLALSKRFYGIIWGTENFATVTEGLSKTRIRTVSSFNPANPVSTMKKLWEINSDDRYNNPGRFLTADNKWGRAVLLTDAKGKYLYLAGEGASSEGDRPFIDSYEITSGKITRLWRSEAPFYESLSTVIDINKGSVLTSRQSVTEVPNYYLRNLKTGKINGVTTFTNPYPELAGVTKELVKYKRYDGIDLSFILYLPAGYDRKKDGPLPTLLWAYPLEFNDAAAAGQVSGSPYMFTRVSPSSVLVYVTQGYAVLMDASFPIVGASGTEPNDTFIEQLVGNAEAAVNKAVEMGVTDKGRVAVSGHSYGAFMTANLLSYTRIFAAGIARSGAYNRTLTPFGFQSERRSYWEAPDVYNRMSPFMQAEKVKDPLLLIHGMADNNSGTFPIQSERYYAALKGHGAITRLVLLPDESHGYAARESLLHMHWETLRWMDTYVKNKK